MYSFVYTYRNQYQFGMTKTYWAVSDIVCNLLLDPCESGAKTVAFCLINNAVTRTFSTISILCTVKIFNNEKFHTSSNLIYCWWLNAVIIKFIQINFMSQQTFFHWCITREIQSEVGLVFEPFGSIFIDRWLEFRFRIDLTKKSGNFSR